MGKKWFFFPLVIIVFLFSYFASRFIDSGACTRITSDWFIVAFSFILAVATIWNGKITRALLKQTRQAFEIDTFNKIVSSTSQLNAELRKDKLMGKERIPYIENFAVGMLVTLKNIDPTMFERIGEAIKTWNKTDSRTPATSYLKALNKVKKGISVE